MSGALRQLAATAKTVAVAGVGFFTDSYDLFVMNMLNVVFKAEYGDAYPGARLSTAALVGSIVGQLSFGFVADILGRRIGLIITTLLLIAGAVLSGVGYWSDTPRDLFWALTAYRFLLGVGIGGEYPCAATVAAEGAGQETPESAATRGRTILLVFSMQGVGNLAATLAVLVLVQAWGESHLQAVWRSAFLLGALPVVAVLYARIKLRDSSLFKSNQSEGAAAEQQGPGFLTAWALALRMYGWRILSTSGCWFLWDIVYYSNGLFSATIIQQLAGRGGIRETALCQLLLVLVSLPGYFAAALLVDRVRVGRKGLQLLGFVTVGLLHCAVGCLYGRVRDRLAVFVPLYALVFFFYQCGPNSSTFVIPSEVFPTAIRARAHGFSAACGKAGAALGALCMLPLVNAFGGLHSERGPAVAFCLCGVISLAAAPLTLLVPEMAQVPLCKVDESFNAQLELDKLENKSLIA
eukprot:m51a1_g2628 hypothetical protein (465) ;mRNA; f:561508-563058